MIVVQFEDAASWDWVFSNFWAAVQIVAMHTFVADCCDCFGQRTETLDLEWVLRQ